MKNKIIVSEGIDTRIFLIRGVNVMLDRDLATLYEVEVRVLNQAVKRNLERFPLNFMFQLTKKEVITNCDKLGISKYSPSSPYVFTEQGVAMLSSVLKSKKAIAINIQIMNTFVTLRNEILSSASKIEYLQLKKALLLYIEKNDSRVESIINVLDNMMEEKEKPVRKIGFIQ